MLMNKREKLAPVQRSRPPPRNASGAQGKGLSRRPFDGTGNSGNMTGVSKQSSEKDLNWDDISLSSDDSKSFTRFLKKREQEEAEDAKPPKPKKGSSAGRPRTSRGASNVPTAKLSSSNALNRLAAIEARIKNRQDGNRLSMSGSDFALDVSSDMEVKRDVGKTDVKLREMLKKKKEPSQNVFLTLDDPSGTSEEEVSTRNNFLNQDFTSKFQPNADSGARNLASHEKARSKQESGKDLSKSISTKKVTFSEELLQASDIESLDDFMPSHSESIDDPISLDQILQSGIHNVMSLDDLVPSEEAQLQDEDDFRPASALGFAGLHSVEELIPAGTAVQSSLEFVPSVQELHSDSISDAAPNLMSNVRTLDDLLSSASEKSSQEEKFKHPVEKKPRPEIFRSTKTDEASEVEEVASESTIYTEDFHSDAADDDTLKDTESIAQDISDDISITTSISTKMSDSPEKKSSHSSYSSISSSPSSSTITSGNSTPRLRKPTIRTVTAETQTDCVEKPWIPGLDFVDSAYFKPTRLVQGEILDVLSAQNPAAVALHDLLKQQLELTREFISKARILHNHAVDSIPKDYIYGQIDDARLERLKKIWYDDYGKTPDEL